MSLEIDMPRDIPVSNGKLLINFDYQYNLRDLYWPYVAQENHSLGNSFLFGVWIDGQFSWINSPEWKKTLRYDRDSLVTRVDCENIALGLKLVCRDFVDFHEDLYMRVVEVGDLNRENVSPSSKRNVRLFFCHDFNIYGNPLGDTGYYEPERKAVFHYKDQRWFMINTAKINGDKWNIGIDQWAIREKCDDERKRVWHDAEDGELSKSAVIQGSVDSVVALHLDLIDGQSALGCYWIAVGKDFKAVTLINRLVREKGPLTFLERTRSYWSLWVSKEKEEEKDLPGNFASLYRRSLLTIRCNCDNEGAIIAATDFDTTRFFRDTYGYMWGRDGAIAAAALINAGFSSITRYFFRFCYSVLTSEGYLLHKYNPDRSLASSWHGWYKDGHKILPVQEDETALVMWALRLHFDKFHDVEFIKPFYRGFIVRAANWMIDFTDAHGLPLPSYDLWEERRGVHSWTVGTVWAGLQAAAGFAIDFGENDLARKYDDAARKMKIVVTELMWDGGKDRFARSAFIDNENLKLDPIMDASVCGMWLFGMFDVNDKRIIKTMDALENRLMVNARSGGIARYENDLYYQVSKETDKIAGNPWFVCTLWRAQYLIRRAKTPSELKEAAVILNWAIKRALPSGILAEQIDPFTCEPLSASPLTWSHATFALTVQEYMAKCRELRSGHQYLER